MTQIEQYLCPSYYDDDNVLRDCQCGKCDRPADPALAVVKAFTDKGANPLYHDQQMQRLEHEWPSLYFALDRLASLASQDTEEQ